MARQHIVARDEDSEIKYTSMFHEELQEKSANKNDSYVEVDNRQKM